MIGKLTRCICITSLLLSASAAHASGSDMDAVVTCKYRPVPGGYRYYVTIQNNELPSTQAYVTLLDFMLTGGMTDVASPSPWGCSTDRYLGASWSTLRYGLDYRLGVPPSSSLSGFEFTCPRLSTQIRYTVLGHTDTLSLGCVGYAVPQLVPEPSALVGLIGGLGALGLLLLRRRK